MANQETEYARKDFQSAVGALLSNRGIEMTSVLARGGSIRVGLHYGNIEQDGIPDDLKAWIENAYKPRRVGFNGITLGISSEPGIGPKGQVITTIHPWATIEVAAYVGNTEEQIIAERAKVVIPDPEVFGLRVEHEVREAEHLMKWSGIILPDQDRVLSRRTILRLDYDPMIWMRGYSPSVEDWTKDPLEKRGKYTADKGALEITIVRSLINHILEDVRGGIIYTESLFGTKRDISPRMKIEIY